MHLPDGMAEEAHAERRNMREAAHHEPEPPSGERVVSKVERQDGTYVALGRGGRNLGEAGALNILGEPMALSDGNQLFFSGRKDFRVEPDAHKDGVLFIE